MRNPERIDEIITQIGIRWRANPDWRLNQLLQNIDVSTRGDDFYLEDDEVMKTLLITDIPLYDMANTYTDSQGSTLRVHDQKRCLGSVCVIHNPSDHHMREWPTLWSAQHFGLIVRRCGHTYWHPDPDSLRYYAGLPQLRGYRVHQCDGCCVPA